MESRHALVSKSVGTCKRSAVMVSLASGRLTEFEQRVAMNPHSFEDVAMRLETVRNPRQQAEVLQLVGHPRIAPVWQLQRQCRWHVTRLARCVREVVYHMALADQYMSTAVPNRALNEQSLRVARLRNRMERESESHTSGREAVVRHAMELHLIAACHRESPGYAISLQPMGPSSPEQLYMSSLSDALATPAGRPPVKVPASTLTGHPRAQAALAADDGEDEWDENAEFATGGGTMCPDMVDIYLRVVHIGGGAMRLPPLSLASGRRLRHGEVAVSMHQVCQVMADSCAVISHPHRLGDASTKQVGLLSLGQRTPQLLRQGARVWEKKGHRCLHSVAFWQAAA